MCIFYCLDQSFQLNDTFPVGEKADSAFADCIALTEFETAHSDVIAITGEASVDTTDGILNVESTNIFGEKLSYHSW